MPLNNKETNIFNGEHQDKKFKNKILVKINENNKKSYLYLVCRL